MSEQDKMTEQETEVTTSGEAPQEKKKQEVPTRSMILMILAGCYLVYTGYRLCANVISGAEDSSVGFLVAGGIFVVIGAVLLIMAVRNLAKAGAQKHDMEEAAAKKAAEEAAKDQENAAAGKKRMSIAERAHLAENLDDAPEEEAK